MLRHIPDFTPLLVPLSLAGLGLALGILFRLLAFPRLSRLAGRTVWKGDDFLLDATRGVSVFWFALAGAYIGSRLIILPSSLEILVQRGLIIGLILSITWVAARIASGLVRLYAPRTGSLSSATLFSNVVNIAVLTMGGLVLFQTLGVAVTPILTALGVGGLAVALALQDTLANLFAGIYIAASGQLRPGDFLRLDTGEEGTVHDIGWRNTTLRNLADNTIVIPNAKLAKAIVTNYSLPTNEMAFVVPVGAAYGSDLAQVERVTVDVARQVISSINGGVAEFEPVVRYHRFGESSIEFNVVFRARAFTDQFLLKHEFIKRLHVRYQQENIEIPFPVRTVRIEPTNAMGSKT